MIAKVFVCIYLSEEADIEWGVFEDAGEHPPIHKGKTLSSID